MDYTSRYKGVQFRSPTYLDGHVEPYEFDLVKWVKRDKPMEVVDGRTGEKVMSDEYCYSIGRLVWDEKDGGFDFKSIGMRYLEESFPELNSWVLAFVEMKAVELREEGGEI